LCGRFNTGRWRDHLTIKVVVNLVVMNAFTVAAVQFYDLLLIMRSYLATEQMKWTYTPRLGYFDDGQSRPIRPLHLDVKLFMADNEDDVDCERVKRSNR